MAVTCDSAKEGYLPWPTPQKGSDVPAGGRMGIRHKGGSRDVRSDSLDRPAEASHYRRSAGCGCTEVIGRPLSRTRASYSSTQLSSRGELSTSSCIGLRCRGELVGLDGESSFYRRGLTGVLLPPEGLDRGEPGGAVCGQAAEHDPDQGRHPEGERYLCRTEHGGR